MSTASSTNPAPSDFKFELPGHESRGYGSYAVATALIHSGRINIHGWEYHSYGFCTMAFQDLVACLAPTAIVIPQFELDAFMVSHRPSISITDSISSLPQSKMRGLTPDFAIVLVRAILHANGMPIPTGIHSTSRSFCCRQARIHTNHWRSGFFVIKSSSRCARINCKHFGDVFYRTIFQSNCPYTLFIICPPNFHHARCLSRNSAIFGAWISMIHDEQAPFSVIASRRWDVKEDKGDPARKTWSSDYRHCRSSPLKSEAFRSPAFSLALTAEWSHSSWQQQQQQHSSPRTPTFFLCNDV